MSIRIDIKADPASYEPLAGDWMCEGLIRGQVYTKDSDGRVADRVNAIVETGVHKKPGHCAEEGCEAKLDRRNTSGYCVRHVQGVRP